ncbi:hypothetical protein ACLB2K_076731 [Fragaria x ananassa]
MELGRWLIHACTISIVLLLHINASLSLGHHHANVTARCLERERDALLAIKGDLVDEYNLLSSWGSEDCCGWERVHCDPHAGHVIQLHLGGVMEVSQRGLDQLEMYNPQLYFSDLFYQQGQYILKQFGGQVSPKIIELQYLEYLDLSLNYFNATQIPALICSLSNLRHLDLHSNSLDGSKIPELIGNLTNLRYLDLSWNSLGDKILVPYHQLGNLTHLQYLNLGSSYYTHVVENLNWLPHLSSLKYLGLSGTNLSKVSDWLETINKLPNLKNLILYRCDLPPPILSTLSHINSSNSLVSVDLSDNVVTSSILKWLCNYNTTLAVLNLPYTQLKGLIPDVFTNMRSLKTLDLSSNQLSGLIPDVFANMSSLAYLDLSSNQLSGLIPDVFANMKSLANLYLSSNQLSGLIPDVFANMKSLANLDLSSNQLSGSIPDVFANMKSLANLDLSSNQLSGSIPDVFANMKSLANLDLSSNQLSGLIPDVFANMKSLANLDLSSNQLSGLIPDVFANMKSLANLDLSSNQLSGLIPDVFTNMRSLKTLDLSFNQLNGLIPFANMSSLAYLDLSSNQLNGLIPNAFANMSSLAYLDLSRNPLKGGIPASISQLCSLRSVRISSCNMTDQLVFYELVQRWSTCPYMLLNSLDLSDNNLAGSFPNLTNFSSLEVLRLSKNKFSGMVPDSIGQLSRLSKLDLSGNQLSGRIPESIGQLSSLSYMNLSVNHLEGEISEIHFSKLFNLMYLDLSGNSLLKFNVTSGWVPSFQLSYLGLKSCNVGPKFPKWLRTQKGLYNLDMSYGHIVDVFPSWLWTIFGDFPTIDLSYNQLKGTIRSSEVVSLSGVEVRFSSNQLEGPIPSFLSNTSYVDLSDNKLSDMSSFVCSSNFKISKFLDLSKNRISGEVPDCWRQWVDLELLDLSDNSFSGKIPPSIGYIHGIKTLKLRSNKLVGALPSSLKNCTSLNVIDLGNNQLSSSVPDWIGASLPDLVILMLQFNQLSGSLPSQLCHLPHLQILDVSVNEISGTIPKCLNNLTSLAQEGNSNLTIRHSFNISEAQAPTNISSLYYEDDATFMWKGTLVSYKSTLGLVKRIDLSSNRLTGGIPSEITSLVGLVSLNLSRNSLTGEIPLEIGNLKSLDSLDLSRNKLHGGIPMSLAHIDRLGAMNLSYNNLSGEIPTGTQLQGFNASSYIGNPWLCGLPLHVCDPEGTGRPNVSCGEDDADELITQGFYVSLGLGFAVGFWGICGSLIFKKSWRYAYYNFLNASNDWLYVNVVLIRRQLKDMLNRQQS